MPKAVEGYRSPRRFAPVRQVFECASPLARWQVARDAWPAMLPAPTKGAAAECPPGFGA
jgi:hypothetical protein